MSNIYFSQYVSPNIVIVPTVSFSEPSSRQTKMVGQVTNEPQETPGPAKNDMCIKHHQNLSSIVPSNNVPVQENHRSVLINNSLTPKIQEEISASMCNNVCVKTQENKCNVNLVTNKDVIKTVPDVESEKMVQKTLSWASNYLRSIGQIHPKFSKQQLSQTTVQQQHKQAPKDNEKFKQNVDFPCSSNSSLNISFADNAQYSTSDKHASTLPLKLPTLKYETQDNSNSIKINLLTHRKRVSKQHRTNSNTLKKYMNTIVQNTNEISLNTKKDSIKKGCENGRRDDAPSGSPISLQSRKPKNSTFTEKARKHTRSTHHTSSSSTSNKKNTLKASESKYERNLKETQSKARIQKRQLLTPKKKNSSKPKHDAQRLNSYSVKFQSTLSPKKQKPSISGSYNIKQHKENRDLLAKKKSLKKAKVYEKHGDTVNKEDIMINSSKTSNKSFQKSKEKEFEKTPKKSSATIKSVVHTCTESFDHNNYPVSQFQETQHKEDLRNKLKRKHPSSINTKRENLIITVQNEEHITANHSAKKNSNPPKIKQDTRKFKKIKLVINLSCEQCSDSSESDNDSINNEYSVPNVDLSFLDDFNVDDIVDCLKTPEENGTSHVFEPFKTSHKIEIPPDNNNNENEIKIETKNSDLNTRIIPGFIKDGINKKLEENDLHEIKKETVINNLKRIDPYPILKIEAGYAKGDNVKDLIQTKVVENKIVFDLVDIMKSSLEKDINIMSTNYEDLTKNDMPLTMIETPENESKIKSSEQILPTKVTAIMKTAVNTSLAYQNTATLDISEFPNSSISKTATIKTVGDMQPTKVSSIINNDTIVISDSEDEQTSTTTKVNCNSTKSNINSNKELKANNIIDLIDISPDKDDLNHEPSFAFDATQVLDTKHNNNIYPQLILPKEQLQSNHLCDSLEQKKITSIQEVTMTQGHDDKRDEIDSYRISEKGEAKSNVKIKNCINTMIENKGTESNPGNNTSKYVTSKNVEPKPNAENDTSKNSLKDRKDIVIPKIKNNNPKHNPSEAKNIANVENKIVNHDDTGKANDVAEVTKNIANVTYNSSSQANIKNKTPTNNVFTVNKALAMILQNRLLDYFGVHYIITNLLRHGKYSKIFQCKDSDGNLFALKMMNKTPKPIIPYNAKEVMLKSLQKDVPKENFYCIFFIDGLSIKGHWCFLMEYYPSNLQVALRENGKCFHLDVIQKLSRQLVSAIVLLRNNNIAHLGIKPEHILLNSTNDKLKLAGFDEAQYIDQITLRPNYGTPSYRPPEVLLGYPSFHKIDVWAVACIMYEMATCRKLFPGYYNNGILYKQQCILGNIPYDMLYQSFYKDFHYSGPFFVRKYGVNFKNTSTIHKFTRTAVIGSTIFNAYNTNWRTTRTKKEKLQDSKKLGQFRELLEQMLALHPNARLPIEFVYTSQFIYESFDSNLWR